MDFSFSFRFIVVFRYLLLLLFLSSLFASTSSDAVICALPRCIRQDLFEDYFDINMHNGNTHDYGNQPTLMRWDDDPDHLWVGYGCNNGAAYLLKVSNDGGHDGKLLKQNPAYFKAAAGDWQNAHPAPFFARRGGAGGNAAEKLYIEGFFNSKILRAFIVDPLQTATDQSTWDNRYDSESNQNGWFYGQVVRLSSGNRVAWCGYDAGDANSGGVRQTDIATGAQMKRAGTFMTKSRQLLVDDDDVVYGATTEGKLFAADMSNQAAPSMKYENKDIGIGEIEYQSLAWADGEAKKTKLLICNKAGDQCACLARSDGSVLWTKSGESWRGFRAVVLPSFPGTVFVCTMYKLHALSVDDGSEIWASDSFPEGVQPYVQFLGDEDTIYVLTTRWIVAVNATKRGRFDWIFSISKHPRLSYTGGSGQYSHWMALDQKQKRIYFATDKGTLVKIGPLNATRTQSRSVTESPFSRSLSPNETRTLSRTINITLGSKTLELTQSKPPTSSLSVSRNFTRPPTATRGSSRVLTRSRETANGTLSRATLSSSRSEHASASASPPRTGSLSRNTDSISRTPRTPSRSQPSRSDNTQSLFPTISPSRPSSSLSESVQPPCGDRIALVLDDPEGRRRTAQLISPDPSFWLRIIIRYRKKFSSSSSNNNNKTNLELAPKHARFSSFIQRDDVQIHSEAAAEAAGSNAPSFIVLRVERQEPSVVRFLVRASSLSTLQDVKLRASVGSSGFDCAVPAQYSRGRGSTGEKNITSLPRSWSRKFPFGNAAAVRAVRQTARISTLTALAASMLRSAGGSTGALTSALAMQRSDAIQQATTCEQTNTDGELSVIVSPLQMRIGGSYARGCILGNLCLFVAFIVLSAIWVMVKSASDTKWLARRKKMEQRRQRALKDLDAASTAEAAVKVDSEMLLGCVPFSSAEQGKINFPSLLWPPLVVLSTGSITAALNLLSVDSGGAVDGGESSSSSDSNNRNLDITLCCVAFAFYSFVCYHLLRPLFPILLFKRWTQAWVPEPEPKPLKNAPLAKRIAWFWKYHVACNYRWRILRKKKRRAGNDDNDGEEIVETTPEQFCPRKTFLARFAVVFDNQCRRLFFASMIECVLAAASSLSSALFNVGGLGACSAARFIIALTIALTAVLSLQMPYVSGWESIFSTSSASMMVVSTLALFSSIFISLKENASSSSSSGGGGGGEDDDAANNLQLLAELVDLMLNALCMVKFCVDVFFILFVFFQDTGLQSKYLVLAKRAKRARRVGRMDDEMTLAHYLPDDDAAARSGSVQSQLTGITASSFNTLENNR